MQRTRCECCGLSAFFAEDRSDITDEELYFNIHEKNQQSINSVNSINNVNDICLLRFRR